MSQIHHLNTDALEAGLQHIRLAPLDHGRLEMIVRRPDVEVREDINEGTLDMAEGLVGDNWSKRPSPRTSDGSPHPDMQLNIMNTRVISLLAGTKDRWKLAGDQLFTDLNLGNESLPPGTRLSIGTAVIEITDQPHTGCKKFAARFGSDALKFVNSPEGRALNLRGVNARVTTPGNIAVGDTFSRV